MITDNTYLAWQKKISENKLFGGFWIFWGIYTVPFIFLLGLYLAVVGKWQELILLALSFILARLIISPVIYSFYKRERPYQKLNFTPPNCKWLFSGLTTRQNSFPSDHANSFASVVLLLFWFNSALALVLSVVMILNGMARVILGYHHVSDILAGWLVGLISAVIVVYGLMPLLFTR